MKRIQYTQSFFEVGGDGVSRPTFEAGQHYEVTEETQRHVARGIAVEIVVADEPPPQATDTPAERAEPAAEPVAAAKKSKKA